MQIITPPPSLNKERWSCSVSFMIKGKKECVLWNWRLTWRFVESLRKFTVRGTKEISEQLRKRLVAAHQTGKYYKSICKVFGLQRSPFGQTVYKWGKFKMIVPHSGVMEGGDHKDPRQRAREITGILRPRLEALFCFSHLMVNKILEFQHILQGNVVVTLSEFRLFFFFFFNFAWWKMFILNFQRIFKENTRTLRRDPRTTRDPVKIKKK